MKNKKGFTLIELLAILVVLAIIALISIPITIKIIKSARENSYKRSIASYAETFKLAVANDALNNSNIQYIGICRAFLSEPDILTKWKNCDDKKSQCVSCMNCYKIDNSIEIECIINFLS